MKKGNRLLASIFIGIFTVSLLLRPCPTFAGNILATNHILFPGESINSLNGQFQFILQEDGNLVLYHGKKALWTSRTKGKGGRKLVMQRDGNLVLYGKRNPVWATSTNGNRGAYLKLQNDGNLVIYKAVWSTGTAK